jgi:hypothetical protein
MHTHGVKNKYTTSDEHLFCKNLADQLVDCIRKKYQVELEATSTKLSPLLLKNRFMQAPCASEIRIHDNKRASFLQVND